MRQGHTEAVPVDENADPLDAKVKFTVEVEIALGDLQDLQHALVIIGDGLQYSDRLFPAYQIASQAYRAAKTQLGAVHVNGTTKEVEADFDLAIYEACMAVPRTDIDGLLGEIHDGLQPQDLADRLGIVIPDQFRAA